MGICIGGPIVRQFADGAVIGTGEGGRVTHADGLIGVRPIVTVSLAGDHRATDGATGALYLQTVSQLLQQPEEL